MRTGRGSSARTAELAEELKALLPLVRQSVLVGYILYVRKDRLCKRDVNPAKV